MQISIANIIGGNYIKRIIRAFTVDTTTYKVDSTLITADKTIY